MHCPICQEKLSQINLDNFKYYQCQKCQGMLASGDVIAHLTKQLQSSVKAKEPKFFEAIDTKNIYTLQEKKLGCPVCHQQMMKLNYAYDSNVFADKCPNCLNIWLQEGELELIAKHLKLHPAHKSMGKALVEMDRDYLTDTMIISDPRVIISYSPLVVGDDDFRQSFPIVTALIISITLLVNIFLLIFMELDLEAIFSLGASITSLSLFSLVSTQVIHSDAIHLFGNMLMLWVFGDNVEDSLGHWRYFVFYLLTGMASTLIFVLLAQNQIPIIGASGAVSAIMGAYLIFYPKNKIKIFWINRIYRLKATNYLLFFFVQQFLALLIFGLTSPVAYLGHIAGFLLGAGLAIIFKETNQLAKIDN